MEQQLAQFAGEYWPHLLGAAFLGLIAINFRSWLAGRQADTDSAK
jgi:hypothetical protein